MLQFPSQPAQLLVTSTQFVVVHSRILGTNTPFLVQQIEQVLHSGKQNCSVEITLSGTVQNVSRIGSAVECGCPWASVLGENALDCHDHVVDLAQRERIILERLATVQLGNVRLPVLCGVVELGHSILHQFYDFDVKRYFFSQFTAQVLFGIVVQNGLTRIGQVHWYQSGTGQRVQECRYESGARRVDTHVWVDVMLDQVECFVAAVVGRVTAHWVLALANIELLNIGLGITVHYLVVNKLNVYGGNASVESEWNMVRPGRQHFDSVQWSRQ